MNYILLIEVKSKVLMRTKNLSSGTVFAVFRYMKFFIFIFFLMFGYAEFSNAKTAYIAIAGSGDGAGMMGHAFAVISEGPGQFLTAEAYQYGIKFPENSEFSINQAINLSDFPFVVTQFPAWSFISMYNSENRFVHLFELSLSDSDVDKFVSLLNRELKIRSKETYFDYSVESSNCLTKIYDLLNLVIPDIKNRFEYSAPSAAIYDFSFIKPKIVAATIPLSASANLINHNMTVNVVKFRSNMMRELETSITGSESLNILFNECNTSENLKNIIIIVYGNSALRNTLSYVELITNTFGSCVQNKNNLIQNFNFHLDFIGYMSSDQKFISELSHAYQTTLP